MTTDIDKLIEDIWRLQDEIEKFNCLYCGYASGLMAYAQEIVARTEQFRCPLKDARRIRGAHNRYSAFAEYGDAESHQARLAESRKELRRETGT